MSVFAHKTDKSKFLLGNESDLSEIGDGTAFNAIKATNEAVGGKQDILTFDDTPTENSDNPVKSGGVYSALSDKAGFEWLPIFGTQQTGQMAIADALAVDLSVAHGNSNRVAYVYAGYTASLPSDCQLGIREVFYWNSTRCYVKITGSDSSGNFKTWGNHYNGVTWTGWKTAGFSNASTSVAGSGRSYTAPQSGSYIYKNIYASNTSNVIAHVNNVSKGNTVGSNGCLGYGQSGSFSFGIYLLQLNAGDVVTAGTSFEINLLI